MKSKQILAAAVVAVLIVGVLIYRYVSQPMEQYTATFLDVFHTSTTIIGYAKDEETFTEDVTLLKEQLEYYHKLYDIYHNYDGINNIKTINDNAGIAPVKVDKEIIELLLLAKEMYQQTEGQINVAMGSVLVIWHNYRDTGMSFPEDAALPPMEKLQDAALHTDIDKMIIDEAASTVYLEDPKMSIDVGSIGKGYAVEQVAQYAKEKGMEHILFSVGGNIRAIGTKADGTPWRLGIQNPDTSSDTAYVKRVQIAGLSLVTSGDYQRYYMVDGEKYCHIIDPDTMMPAKEFASVSIIAQDSGVADALSTSVFNMSLQEGKDFINGLDGVEAAWILHDGSMEYSDGFSSYIIE
jgi:thiamine biosynthesis lipoprotein